MTKFTKEKLYTELSIQIATLEAKVDKVLQLLIEQKEPVECDIEIKGFDINWDEEFK